MRALLVALVIVSSTPACRGAGDRPPDGAERGRCYGNGTCDDGLQCLSDLCVRPPGADCRQVATRLAGLLLGNYAPRAERDAFVAATRDECAAANLTIEEATCLTDAPHRNALARCPKRIGVGDCGTIVPHLETLRTDPFLVTSADRLAARCKNEVPSRAFEACALAARTVADLDRCAW